MNIEKYNLRLRIYYLDEFVTINENLKTNIIFREFVKHFLCKFEPRLVKKWLDNICVMVVYKCKYCNILTPNPVLMICTRYSLEPNCICINDGLLCSNHDETTVSRIDTPCDFRLEQEGNPGAYCWKCYSFAHVECIQNLNLVCRTSRPFEFDDFYGSNEFIHRFYNKPGLVFVNYEAKLLIYCD